MYQMLSLWYSITSGRFAFNINATSTPTPKNGIRMHSRAFGGIGVLAWRAWQLELAVVHLLTTTSTSIHWLGRRH
jgi:hypothetical protein